MNALRTEPGSARQPVHWDTPFQAVAPLYTAFVALQDVTIDMGARARARPRCVCARARARTRAWVCGDARGVRRSLG